MKPDPSFPKLPAIGELLKHPAVEQVVERVNKTTIAQRATGFLEELQASLRKSASRIEVPSVHELAERLARRLLGSSDCNAPVINATGAIWGDLWPAPPMAEPAVHRMMQQASEYCEAGSELRDRVAGLLTDLTEAESAWAAHDFDGAVELAQGCGFQVDVAPYAGLIDPADYGLLHVATLRERLSAEADLVIAKGAGLLGGPQCGICLGNSAAIEELTRQPLATHFAASPLVLAALEATLEIYKANERVEHRIPALQLLSTPVENLEQRCARLAPLLEENGLIASATPTRCESIWLDTVANKLAGPTWAIKLVPAEGSAGAVAEAFRNGQPRLVCRDQQDENWLDLRSVFPRWDQQLVATLDEAGSAATSES